MPDMDRDDDLLRLDDALKLAGVVGTGGEAKVLIQSGEVRVNGVVETRRKRKLDAGDVIEVGDEVFEIAMSDDESGDEDPHGDAVDEGPEDEPSDDDDDLPLAEEDLEEWRTWIEGRVAEGDVEAVIIRLGGLDPRRLEAVFARLPKAVEEVVLDALDEVLERSEGWDDDMAGDAFQDDQDEDDEDARGNDGPMRA